MFSIITPVLRKNENEFLKSNQGEHRKKFRWAHLPPPPPPPPRAPKQNVTTKLNLITKQNLTTN